MTSAWPQPKVYCHCDFQTSKAFQLHATSKSSSVFHRKLLSIFSYVKIHKVNCQGCSNANVILLDFSAPMTLIVALENVRVLFIRMQELSLPKKAYTVCDLEQAHI